MSLQVEKQENNMAKLTIEAAAERFEEAIESTYNKQKSRISVPGFRKGKAPRKLLEQMYGKGVFYEDAANELIPVVYEEALEECTEDIVSSPKIEVVQMEAGKPFIFTAEVALKPGVTLGKYKGVSVEKADLAVTDEEVDEEIKKDLDKNARTVDVTDRPVKDGDITTIDFEGFVDGVAFEGGKGTDYPLTIGSGAFIPGFEEALIGAEIGKETDVNVTFPEDYQAKELAGKPAVFKCTVKKISEKQLPAVEENAEDLGFDSVDDYRKDVKEKIELRKADAAKSAKEDAVISAIVEDAKMDIPDAMLETQQKQIIDEFAQRMRAQGLTMEQYMQYTGLDNEKMMDQVKPEAMNRIQTRLVLEAVAKAEKLEATEDDFNEEVKTMGAAYQLDEDKVKEMLGVNGKKQVLEDIRIKKALEFAVENAKETKPAAAKKDQGKESEE